MLALRFLGSLYPLLKDIFLGKRSIKESLKDGKLKLLVLLGVILSILMNFYLIPKTLELSIKIIELNKMIEELNSELKVMRMTPSTKPNTSTQRESTPKDNYNSLDFFQEEFDHLKK